MNMVDNAEERNAVAINIYKKLMPVEGLTKALKSTSGCERKKGDLPNPITVGLDLV